MKSFILTACAVLAALFIVSGIFAYRASERVEELEAVLHLTRARLNIAMQDVEIADAAVARAEARFDSASKVWVAAKAEADSLRTVANVVAMEQRKIAQDALEQVRAAATVEAAQAAAQTMAQAGATIISKEQDAGQARDAECLLCAETVVRLEAKTDSLELAQAARDTVIVIREVESNTLDAIIVEERRSQWWRNLLPDAGIFIFAGPAWGRCWPAACPSKPGIVAGVGVGISKQIYSLW